MPSQKVVISYYNLHETLYYETSELTRLAMVTRGQRTLFLKCARQNSFILCNVSYFSDFCVYSCSGLEPPVFAALVPYSANKPLTELIDEIMGDHELLVSLLTILFNYNIINCFNI